MRTKPRSSPPWTRRRSAYECAVPACLEPARQNGRAADRCSSPTAGPVSWGANGGDRSAQLEDALEFNKFGDDHRDVSRWLKERREQIAVGEVLVDAAAAELAVKKLEDQVCDCALASDKPNSC